MEQITVISGSGEHIELSLPGTAALHSVVTACRKIIEMPAVSAREKIIGLFRNFFPEHYREALERISGADALKLASAFVLLLKKSKVDFLYFALFLFIYFYYSSSSTACFSSGLVPFSKVIP